MHFLSQRNLVKLKRQDEFDFTGFIIKFILLYSQLLDRSRFKGRRVCKKAHF